MVMYKAGHRDLEAVNGGSQVVKEFSNSVGNAQVIKYSDECWACRMSSETAMASSFETFRYKYSAIEAFQFYCGWLERNKAH